MKRVYIEILEWEKSLVTDGTVMYGWQVYGASGFLKMLKEI